MNEMLEYPRWIEIDGDCRCTECGEMTDITWRFHESPTKWLNALCWPCAQKLLREAKANAGKMGVSW